MLSPRFTFLALALALLSSVCGAAAALTTSGNSLGSSSNSSSSLAATATGTCNKMNLTGAGAAGEGGANSGSDTAVGAAIAIVASVISNVGVNVQKAAHVRNERAPKEARLPFTKMPIWWVGMGGVVAGSLGDFAALGFATQALVAALGGATTLATNLAIARWWHKEPGAPSDVLGVLAIIGGAIIIAVETPSADDFTLEDMYDCASQGQFIIFLVVLSCVIALLLGGVASSSFYRWKERLTDALLAPLARRLDRLSDAEVWLWQRVRDVEVRNGELAAEVELCKRALGRAGHLPGLPNLAEEEEGGGGGGGVEAAAAAVAAPAAAAAAAAAGAAAAPAAGAQHHPPTLPRQMSAATEALLLAHGSRSAFSSLNHARHMPDRHAEPTQYFAALLNPNQETMEKIYARWSDAYYYASCAGAIGAVSVLLAGLVAKTIVQAIDLRNNQFGQVEPWVFIFGMLVSIFGQTKYLNEALMLGDVGTIFPVFQGFWIGFGVIGGMVFYEQGHLIFYTNYADHVQKGAALVVKWSSVGLYLLAASLIVGGCAVLVIRGRKNYRTNEQQLNADLAQPLLPITALSPDEAERKENRS